MIGFWDFKRSGAPPLLSFGVHGGGSHGCSTDGTDAAGSDPCLICVPSVAFTPRLGWSLALPSTAL